MYQGAAHVGPSLHRGLLVFVLTALTRDLSNGRGVRAWTYNYSTTQTRNWESARRWCQLKFTDMLAIQNQEETDYLNQLLPFRRTYYWIGIRKVNGVWTWLGTNRSLSTEAENWATGEPNNIRNGQDCVEIYIKREKDTAKWNDENCKKRKSTVCYTASCSELSCSVHADCVETIGNYTCQCHPGFQGPRCEEVEQCPALDLAVSGGTMNCSHPVALHSYNSTCELSCDEGYDLVGQNLISCDHTGHWTSNVSTCTVKRCAPISSPTAGNVTCRGTLGSFSFGSRCSFTCREGYSLSGHHTLTCQASARWSAARPECTAVQCSTLETPPHGSLRCQHPVGEFSYGSTCTTQCNEGFDLIGNNFTQCSSTGNWSDALPVCQARQCPILATAPHQGWMNCSHPYFHFSHGSQCEFGCHAGFWLQGASTIQCNTSGVWSHELPTCQVMRCDVISAPSPPLSMNCSHPLGNFSYGSRCAFSCEAGYAVNGTEEVRCASSGRWDSDTPTCTAISCGTLLDPEKGSVLCDHLYGPHRFNSSCWFHCDLGYRLVGAPRMLCQASGSWDHPSPLCQVEQCPALYLAVSGGTMNCSHPVALHSYNSTCELSCDEGYDLVGQNLISCDHTGHWTSNVSTCTVKRCAPISSPTAGSVTCRGTLGSFSFGSRCSFTCREGYSLSGHHTVSCQASARWSAARPECTAVQCSTLEAPPHGSLRCQHPVGGFSYGSTCTTQCNEGFDLIGNNFTQCSSTGNWSDALPVCQARQCPILATAPHRGWMNCSHPYFHFSHGSQCEFGCNKGFWLQGASTIQCNTSGVWSHELPTCQVVRCDVISAPSRPLSMNCSHPRGNFSYGSRCAFSCEAGYAVNGTEEVCCASSGRWNKKTPTCTVVRCDVISAPSRPLSMNCSHPLRNFSYGSRCAFGCEAGYAVNGTEEVRCAFSGRWDSDTPTCTEEGLLGSTAMLVYGGAGTASVAAVLGMTGLLILLTKQKKGIMNMEESFWERENPAFEF
ncbi:P-selectin [Lampris incognitus]|uniref:P-selectin n=1 Tax=Lampris incognitus TaxID=2546036 RepID=UPI0024B4CD79|nr:P-selectin [Lampris incognitus]